MQERSLARTVLAEAVKNIHAQENGSKLAEQYEIRGKGESAAEIAHLFRPACNRLEGHKALGSLPGLLMQRYPSAVDEDSGPIWTPQRRDDEVALRIRGHPSCHCGDESWGR